jgi:hypothetical protein
MSASFPTNVKTWSPLDETYPRNLETVRAFHVTDTYFEITAIEQELGTGGLRTSVTDNATAFNPSTSTNLWGSLRLRLNNMEQGVLDGVNRRVNTGGGSTITPGAIGTVGLNIRAASGQTANLLEIRNSSNTVVNRFNASGQFVGVIDGGTA